MKLQPHLQQLYKLIIEPRSGNTNAQNRELVLNWLLAGSLLLAGIAFLNTAFSWLVLNSDFVEDRILSIGIFSLLLGGLLILSRRTNQHRLPSFVLVGLLIFAATSVVFEWGIINPVGILLFGLVIVMASILLGARFALYMALVSSLVLTLLEIAKAHHLIMPNLDWEKQPSSPTDVVSFSAIFAILALTSWLFNRQMERALARAEQSEKALKHERDLLEVKVEQRTQALQAAQLEQVQEVYRFAELGHLSTALFHDLANHIMSVSLDIAGLQKGRRSDLLARIQDNVQHIDDVVRRVQHQIRGQAKPERFNVIDEIKAVIKILTYFSNQSQVKIELQVSPQANLFYSGDLTRFRQIVINLLSNAIESYPKASDGSDRKVIIRLSKSSGYLVVEVIDYGRGIPASKQAKIFEPFYTTKSTGMGIGLFIVKKVVEKDFGGRLTVNSGRTGTSFTVNLPLKTNGKPSSS